MSPVDSPVATPAGGVNRRLVVLAVGVVAIACVARAMQLAWLSDDGFISFRYAQNLAEGRGLVYNAGEYVEGYTNLLWTLALAACMRLGAGPEIMSHVLGIACWLAQVALLAWWSWRRAAIEGTRYLPLAAALTLVLEDQQRWATGGLETSMFGLFSSWGLLLLAVEVPDRRRQLLAALLLGLATLTRPDGVLFCALGVAYAFVARPGASVAQRCADSATVAVPLALIGAALVAFKLSYYGDIFPTAFYAKSALDEYSSQGLYYVGLFVERNWFMLPFLALVLWPARRGLRRLWSPVYGLLLVAFVMFTFYVIHSGGDFMYARRLMPALPFLWLLFEALLNGIERQAVALALFLATLVASALPSNPFGDTPRTLLRGIAAEWTFYPRDYVAFCRNRGEFLHRVLGQRPVRAVYSNSLAMLAYYSRLPYLVEYSGLTQYSVAKKQVGERGRVGHEKAVDKAWMTAHGVEMYLFMDKEPLVKNGARRYDYARLGGRLTALIWIYRDEVVDAFRDQPDVDFVPIEAVMPGIEASLARQPYAQARATLDLFESYYLDHAAPKWADTAARMRRIVADKAGAQP
ncbi:MAG: hypothetical protein IPM80_23725 [Proteobacteria bacterium]|nr:hypothetical protein [Pseudomonadota bacterium]